MRCFMCLLQVCEGDLDELEDLWGEGAGLLAKGGWTRPLCGVALTALQAVHRQVLLARLGD